MRFVRNAASVALTSAARVPFAFASGVVLARFLSVDDRGTFAALNNFVLMAMILAQLGLPGAMIYLLRRVGVEPARVTTGGLLGVTLASATTLLLCWAAGPFLIAEFLPGATPTLFLIALALVPFQLLGVVLNGIARGIDRFELQNGYLLAFDLVWVISIAIVLIGFDGELVDALAAMLSVRVVLSLILAALLIRHTGLARSMPDREVRAGLGFATMNYIDTLLGQIHQRLDLILIGWILATPADLAVYAIAVGVAEQLRRIPEALFTALFPVLASQTTEQATRLATTAVRHSLFWVVTAAMVIALIADHAIPLIYGGAYAGSAVILLWLLPAFVMFTPYRVVQNYYASFLKQRYSIGAQSFGVVVNVALCLRWIPEFGILGAAMAKAVSTTVQTTVLLTMFVFERQIGWLHLCIPNRADVNLYVVKFEGLRKRIRR